MNPNSPAEFEQAPKFPPFLSSPLFTMDSHQTRRNADMPPQVRQLWMENNHWALQARTQISPSSFGSWRQQTLLHSQSGLLGRSVSVCNISGIIPWLILGLLFQPPFHIVFPCCQVFMVIMLSIRYGRCSTWACSNSVDIRLHVLRDFIGCH
jgi:hypothetical protein